LLFVMLGGIMDSMAQAFVSTRVVTPKGVRAAAVLEDEGRILGLCRPADIPTSYVKHDFRELTILPGLVDSHVHINEPGRTEWEGFWTATRAAAAGGFTTLVDMPLNCLPETTTVAALEAKREAARRKCFVDWAAWGGVSGHNAEHIEPLARAGVKGFKCFLIYPGCEGFEMVTQAQLERALPHVVRTGLPLLVHAELPEPIDAAMARLNGADWRQYETYLRSRPDEAELSAIRMLLDMCRQYRFRLHIVHLSTALALDELRVAKQEGLPVSVETCPHYLHFAADEIQDGSTLHKCAPPIRGRHNREKLWNAVRERDIDLVATDHSPCPPDWKRQEEGRFDQAWGGVASLSVALPVMWTGMETRDFSLSDLVQLMAERPADLAQLGRRKGKIIAGCDADLVIFDPEAETEVSREALHTRHPVTPYLGMRLRGRVLATYLRGRQVFREGTFADEPFGAEV